MWALLIFLYLNITWAYAQNGRARQDHNGHGWDIRLAVPGEPGSDYPTLGIIPRTSFSCAGREPGYYADLETNCQVFRVCTVGSTYGFQSFLCPNGTLFNQAVFVCDWWMNVDCKNSQQFNYTNEKFENLRLGPQLMKDIKKMLTHPMLNPYDRSVMKNNLIVMQDYKPPLGQLFPNGALLAGPDRPPNNVYVPAKQIQQNFNYYNPNDITVSASTPSSRYIPASDANFESFQRDDDYLQRQRQNDKYFQNADVQDPSTLRNSNLISKSHAGRFIQNPETINNNGYKQQSQAPRPPQFSNLPQKQIYSAHTSEPGHTQNNHRSQANIQRPQYSESSGIRGNNKKIHDFGVTLTEPLNTQNLNTSQTQSPYKYRTPPTNLPQFSKSIDSKAGRELKDNLVSTIKDVPTTVVTKTFGRFTQETKIAKPKSRVTIKTWIVRPTKAARQLVDPSSYTSTRPSTSSLPSLSPSSKETITDDTTPYLYEKPTTLSRMEKIKTTELDSEEPYIYSKPTSAPKQIHTTEFETTRIYIAPTTNPTRAIFSGRLNILSTPILPTKASRYYLTPSPYKSTQRFYLPPPQNPTNLPRLYLVPDIIPPIYYQNAQLRASPTNSSSTRVSSENLKEPPLSLPKQFQIDDNHHNLTFADILTKEKLDLTVNDIVTHTDNILKTASPPQNQYRKYFKSIDYDDSNFIVQPQTARTVTDSGERLTSQSPLQTTMMFSKSSGIVATPATSLVPPDESFIFQNTNQLSKLPFYKETGFPNTIERTVSIKITIPEKIAMYLFKNKSEADYDKLEILNTGSSNYLVLSNNNNNLSSQKSSSNFIPIAKIPGNNNFKNISDSQALVYSFLTDSINVAREYSNIANQEILLSTAAPTPAQFQNLDSKKLTDITNTISDLTSLQFSSNNFNQLDKNAKLIAIPATNNNEPIPFTGNLKYSDDQNQVRQTQTAQYNIPSQQPIQGEFYSSRSPTSSSQFNLHNNQLYSGQLYQWPVPEVTKQIYNKQYSENLVKPNTVQQQTTQTLTLQHNINQNKPAESFKQSNPALEIIKAHTVPIYSSKLQLEPSTEPEQYASQENFEKILSSEDGISAHLQDKIVGLIPHPLEENKIVTYEKDQSYYLYTKFDDNTIDRNAPTNIKTNTDTSDNTNSKQNNNTPNLVSYQFIPSVNYELEDEKEQQNIVNAFQIDEFGAPREISKPNSVIEEKSARQLMTSSVDFSVEHPTSSRRSDRYRIDNLYSGPSSYTAPQSSIGSLESRRSIQKDYSSRLEDFNVYNAKGYSKERPARQFIF